MKITNFCNSKGECSRCGNCCPNFLALTEEEIETIPKYVKEHKIQDNYKHLLKNNIVVLCPFNNQKEGKCDIYEVRPEICRRFKCNKTDEGIDKNRIHFERTGIFVDMREKFCGYKMSKQDIVQIIKILATV